MEQCEIEVTLNPSIDLVDSIGKQLKAFNELQVGPYHREQYVVAAYDSQKRLLGGMVGYFCWGWLYIDIAWVEESQRSRGIGGQLLRAFEQVAIERQVVKVRLNTGSFQAPNFYLKNGYEIFAQLDITGPDGSEQIDYFLKKNLKIKP